MNFDLAQSYLAWLTINFRSARVEKEIINRIETAIPNRLEYFDTKKWDTSNVKEDDALFMAGKPFDELTTDRNLMALRTVHRRWLFVRDYPIIFVRPFNDEKWRNSGSNEWRRFTVSQKVSKTGDALYFLESQSTGQRFRTKTERFPSVTDVDSGKSGHLFGIMR